MIRTQIHLEEFHLAFKNNLFTNETAWKVATIGTIYRFVSSISVVIAIKRNTFQSKDIQ